MEEWKKSFPFLFDEAKTNTFLYILIIIKIIILFHKYKYVIANNKMVYKFFYFVAGANMFNDDFALLFSKRINTMDIQLLPLLPSYTEK